VLVPILGVLMDSTRFEAFATPARPSTAIDDITAAPRRQSAEVQTLGDHARPCKPVVGGWASIQFFNA
jgi:hypothetical protein